VAVAPEAKCVVVAIVAVPACYGVGYALSRVPGVSKVV
jgi:hypothetical protein